MLQVVWMVMISCYCIVASYALDTVLWNRGANQNKD